MGKVLGYTLLGTFVAATAYVVYHMSPDERHEATKSVVGLGTHVAAAAFGSALGQNAGDAVCGK